MPLPIPGLSPAEAVDSAAHIIQDALTPVFLLSGIGTLLNVFNTRLSRVVDRTDHATDLLKHEDDAAQQLVLNAHLRRLVQRRAVLDSSVLLAAFGGAATCGAAFVLFLGGLRDTSVASWLFWLFGIALGCTVCALIAFVADGLLAWHGLRREGAMPQAKRPPA
jgi:hypothetical protein